MGKLPAFLFYPGDWIQDTRCLPCVVKGAWIDILCAMWRSQERGKLTLSTENLARLIGENDTVTTFVINTLKTMSIADIVTNGNGDVTLINRRMVREQKERELTRFRVKRFRNERDQRICNANVTVPSSSSSSSSVTFSKKKHIWSSDDDRECFNSFWTEYPKKVQKQTAIKAWKKLKPDSALRETILFDVKARATSDEWTKDERQFCPYPASYLNGRRWEDEVPPQRDPMGFLKFAKPGPDEEDEPGYNPEYRAPRKGEKP